MPSLTADHRHVLRIVQDQGSMTRARLSVATGWARGTVTQRLTELVEAQWLLESGEVGTERRGRPSSVYTLNATGALIFALSFGQTHVAAALVDLSGKTVVKRTVNFAPQQEIGEALRAADQAPALLAGLLNKAGRLRADVRLCVLGKPGPIDPRDLHAPTAMPGWLDVDVRESVRQGLAMPTLIENDANLMALGYWQATGRPQGVLVFVKVALGMGAGIIIDGRLLRGRRGMAGEIGHLPVSAQQDDVCACGQKDCVARLVSISALLGDLRSTGLKAQTFGDLAELTSRGNPAATAALRQAGRHVGESLLGLVATLAPDVLIIGGPLARLGDHFVTGAGEALYSRSVPALTAGLSVAAAGDHRELGLRGCGVLGATALIEYAPTLTEEVPADLFDRPAESALGAIISVVG